MVDVPWDFSTPRPGEPTYENVPTPEGAELGRQMARLTDLHEREQLKRFPNQHPRCSDCALRLGTLPNQSAATLMDIVKCLAEGHPFYCHKGIADGAEPKRLCSGYMVLASVELPGLAEATSKPPKEPAP